MLLASVANAAQAEQVIVFEDAWIAEAPPVSKVLAAYMVIKNTGDEDMKVISAQSDDFGSIEFHRTVDADGMASMQHQPFLAIPAGDSLVLEPGGYHMMLFKPARKLRAGDESGFQFKLENGKLVNVKARVKKASAEDMHQHHHHH
jgi:copper(I)-binding protein